MPNYEVDNDIHMVKEPVKDFKSTNHLRELRWRMEKGRYGRQPIGVPKGDLVFRLSDLEIKKYALQQADQISDEKIRQHIAANGDY